MRTQPTQLSLLSLENLLKNLNAHIGRGLILYPTEYQDLGVFDNGRFSPRLREQQNLMMMPLVYIGEDAGDLIISAGHVQLEHGPIPARAERYESILLRFSSSINLDTGEIPACYLHVAATVYEDAKPMIARSDYTKHWYWKRKTQDFSVQVPTDWFLPGMT
jgi:hypothetical protein